MATVQDVAKLAGVSPGTVSRVFNGNVNVKKATKERVQKAAEQLNYSPDLMARSLKMKETKTIGLVFPDIGSEGFVATIKSIEAECFRKGYSLILCNSEEDPERENLYIRSLLKRRIDGLILIPVTNEIKRYTELEIEKIPLIILGRMIEGIKADVIKGNDYIGCYESTKYLLELGHRKIGVLSKPLHVPFVEERIRGYKDALIDFGLTFDENLVQYTSHFPSEATKNCEDLILSKKPTAVFSMSNALTTTLLQVIQRNNFSIPEDISVIGYADSKWNTIIKPALTSVALDGYQLGVLAIEKLFKRIKDKNKPESSENPFFEKIILPVTLRQRESCKELNRSCALRNERA